MKMSSNVLTQPLDKLPKDPKSMLINTSTGTVGLRGSAVQPSTSKPKDLETLFYRIPDKPDPNTWIWGKKYAPVGTKFKSHLKPPKANAQDAKSRLQELRLSQEPSIDIVEAHNISIGSPEPFKSR